MSDATAADFLHYEKLYKTRPESYKRKVIGYLALGYGYVAFTILFILGFTLGGTVLFVTGTLSVLWIDNFLRMGIPLLLVAGLLVRAIFVRVPKPEGVYLEGGLKQAVLDAFEDTRQATGGHTIDEVVIDTNLNAAVQQLPRFGLVGPATNYLIIGAPLLRLLTIDEVRAVIAHEFGHLSHQHGRLGSVVYRLNYTLGTAAQTIEEKAGSGFKGASFRFLNWFYRRFSVLTFAMRRGQEYQADAVSAEATDAAALSSSLCKLNALDESLGRFWTRIWSRARQLPMNDTVQPIGTMDVREIYGDEKLDATDAVEHALQLNTDFADSHPCLRDRLETLKVEPVRQFAVTEFAFDRIFSNDEKSGFLQLIDEHWQVRVADNWKQAHADYAASEDELLVLRRKADTANEPMDVQEMYRLASLEESLDGQEVALPRYETIVKSNPGDAVAHFQWGRVNLDRDVETAERAFLKSAELDLGLVPKIQPFINYLAKTGGRDTSEFDAYVTRFRDTAAAADEERAVATLEDEMVAIPIDAERRKALEDYLDETFPELRKLYAAEKVTRHFSHDRAVLLAFVINYLHDNVESNDQHWLDRVSAQIGSQFPELQGSFVTIIEKKGDWADKLNALDGALVFEKELSVWRRLWDAVVPVLAILVLIAIVWAVGSLVYDWFFAADPVELN